MKIVANKYSRKPDPRMEQALRKALNLINSYIDEESVFLPDALDKNSETYFFANDYVMNDWNLDTERIIDDWKSEYDVPLEVRERSPYGMDEWNPRDYLFNILVDLMGMSYEEAKKLLLY